MTLSTVEHPLPRDNDSLGRLHEEIAGAFESGLWRIGEALALTCGGEAADAAFRALLIAASFPLDARAKRRELFGTMSWRELLDEHLGHSIDAIELTHLWRDGAEYAGQGIASHEPAEAPSSIEERQVRIQALVVQGKTALDYTSCLLDDDYDYIWKGVAARAAIDFGGTVTLEGLQLLSDLSLSVVRNAVSIGDLHPDEAGCVSSEEANAWLVRRRGFCPSRWRNPTDNQWPFDPKSVSTADEKGMIWVPQAAEGETFTPEQVVRPSRRTSGISITVGAKGEEIQFNDFYEALSALAKMDVARWRRRNSAGNWGVVRARGAWVAVNKAAIDRLLAKMLAEMC